MTIEEKKLKKKKKRKKPPQKTETKSHSLGRMHQSDSIRQKLFAYSVQAGGHGCWRPAQLPTTRSGLLKYEAEMGGAAQGD